MSTLACNYAVVRFLPYRETGEFINVGVMACCPERNYFDFRLLEKRHKRIRQFFPELNETIYCAAVAAIKSELERHRNASALFTQQRPAGGASAALEAFKALAQRRESLLHFTEPRIKIISEQPDAALDALYAHFVKRLFANQTQYQETVMARRLNQWLREWKLRKVFKKDKPIGDSDFHVTFPFVRFEGDMPIAVIKPFDLDRTEPTDVYKHADPWIQGVRRLKNRKQLPHRVIFTVRWPTGPKLMAAADEIRKELEETDATVVSFDADAVRAQVRD